ncbi:MAG: LlaMI family restriction endonuclease [Nitrosospira sp.]|nr:LlaMI family restriction endonuclease [Nitrosospira sp.]
MSNKQKIIDLFLVSVKGKRPDTAKSNIRHDGKDGHWLEKMMGIAANASNSPDIYGFEMKNDTTSKTTFGDWSANYYVYKDNRYNISRNDFLTIFGKPNAEKNNRYSWSGEPVPKINKINNFGQDLIVDAQKNICIRYFFSKDKRVNKDAIVPLILQQECLLIARWDAVSIKKKLENKFKKEGWFKCLKDENGFYATIVFGDPISFNTWIKFVISGDVFFDSGMYQGNLRNYSQWRAANSFWNKQITSRYP